MKDKIRLVISGITGKMGRVLAKVALQSNDIELKAGIVSKDDPFRNLTLNDLHIANSEAPIYDIEQSSKILKETDVVISFTTPLAEVENIPVICRANVCLVLGTTGFTNEQFSFLQSEASKVPTVISSNFSVGANVMLYLASLTARALLNFDFSIIEAHHRTKMDSPSGTALSIASEVNKIKGYTEISTGRTGRSIRTDRELEIFSIRSGGIPGMHILLAGGDHEILKIEHNVFSREAFAKGALLAARWVLNKPPGIYTMKDVLDLR